MYGKILLLELSFNTGSPAGFHTAGKDIVFDKLLCDGASATGIVVADQAVDRSGDGTDIDTVMGPETGILNGYKGIDQILGQFLIGSRFTVGTAGYNCVGEIAAYVINGSGKAIWLDVHKVYGRGAVDNPFTMPKPMAVPAMARKRNNTKKALKMLKKSFEVYLADFDWRA